MDTRVGGSFDDVVEATIHALESEGFGVRCDIDVQTTLAAKLDLDHQPAKYRILGACNPEFAHEALTEERLLGALLPCNVIVYETPSGSVGVSAVDPIEMLALVDNESIHSIAETVRDQLASALESLPDATTSAQ